MSVPNLRFKEFDGDWAKISFQTLFDFKNGINASKEQYGSGTKFINVLDIINNTNGITYDSIIGSVQVSAKEIEKNIVNYGDVLFQRSSETREEVGQSNVYLSNKPVVFGGFVIRGSAKIPYDPLFMNGLLKTDKIRDQITQLGGGSTRFNIGQDSLNKVLVDFPQQEEQTKIASFLSTVDEKISQLNQKHRLLSEYKQGMMQKLFSQQLRFKADDGSDFGEWEKFKFSEQFNFHNTNSHSRALLTVQGEIMNIHYGDIHTKFSMLFDVKKEVVPFLSDQVNTSKISENQFLKVGDLIIADASEDYKDIGKTIEVINLNNHKVIAGLHTYIARPVNPFTLGFNGYLMQTFEVREQIKKLATGISVLGISKTNLGKIEIKIPCLAEQTQIANFLSAIDQKIETVAQQIEQAKTWKKGLLQQMFV